MDPQDAYFKREQMRIGLLAKTLAEQVADILSDAIREGVIEPGERMKEEVYATRFAVSRSTIREAMAMLERRGLAERIPRYGVRATAYDPQEIKEIFVIRIQLLGLAARLVAERQDEVVLEQLRQGAARLKELALNPDTEPIDYMEMSVHMQRILTSSSGSKRLHTMYEALSDEALWRFAIREKAISFMTEERRQASAKDWERVLNEILAKDCDAAELAAKALLQASYETVKIRLNVQDEQT